MNRLGQGKGRSIPEEVRKKISLGLTGKKLSTETKKKISDKLKNRKITWNTNTWSKGKGGFIGRRSKDQKLEVKRFCNLRYKARKRNADGSHTFGEWERLKAQYNWNCICCQKQEPQIILSEDHIVPLSLGGSDNIENIQPICRSCNSKKHTKTTKF